MVEPGLRGSVEYDRFVDALWFIRFVYVFHLIASIAVYALSVWLVKKSVEGDNIGSSIEQWSNSADVGLGVLKWIAPAILLLYRLALIRGFHIAKQNTFGKIRSAFTIARGVCLIGLVLCVLALVSIQLGEYSSCAWLLAIDLFCVLIYGFYWSLGYQRFGLQDGSPPLVRSATRNLIWLTLAGFFALWFAIVYFGTSPRFRFPRIDNSFIRYVLMPCFGLFMMVRIVETLVMLWRSKPVSRVQE